MGNSRTKSYALTIKRNLDAKSRLLQTLEDGWLTFNFPLIANLFIKCNHNKEKVFSLPLNDLMGQ